MSQTHFPHKIIRETSDRSWTAKLVEAINTASDEELDEIKETLQALDDYRMWAPLTALMQNRQADTRLRDTASRILIGSTTDETPEMRRDWWLSGDEILMCHAICKAERTEIDLIDQIASDPSHPFYIHAIDKITFRFEEARFQRYKIRALSDPDPAVRVSAAESIFWDQPVAAERGLIELALDEDEIAADEAILALAYYSSKSALVALSEMSAIGLLNRRSQYQAALSDIRENFCDAYFRLENKSKVATALFKSWLGNTWTLLDYSQYADLKARAQNQAVDDNKPIKQPPELPIITKSLDHPDTNWPNTYEFLDSFDWQVLQTDERKSFINYILRHPDWLVRDASCRTLASLGASDALVTLLDDPVPTVRKAATYWLCEVTPDPEIAVRLWTMLTSGLIGGTQSSEAVKSYVVHSAETDLDKKLCKLIYDNPTESVRTSAISSLIELKSIDAVRSLLPLLNEDPIATWAVHVSLLEACVTLKLDAPEAKALTDVDDLFLQEMLALLLTATF